METQRSNWSRRVWTGRKSAGVLSRLAELSSFQLFSQFFSLPLSGAKPAEEGHSSDFIRRAELA